MLLFHLFFSTPASLHNDLRSRRFLICICLESSEKVFWEVFPPVQIVDGVDSVTVGQNRFLLPHVMQF